MDVDSPFVDEYLEAMRPRLWPVYLILTTIVGWLGFVTIMLLAVYDPTAGAAAGRLGTYMQLYMFMVFAIPFVTPAAIAATRCWLGGER